MVPPHTRKLREEKTIEIYALHKHTDWGYNKIAKSTSVSKSTVRGVVKRGDTRNGDTHNAHRPERPTKISATKKKLWRALWTTSLFPHYTILQKKQMLGWERRRLTRLSERLGSSL
jgi:transposase